MGMGLEEDRLERGIAYKIEGRYEEATHGVQALLAGNPDHAEAHHQLGTGLRLHRRVRDSPFRNWSRPPGWTRTTRWHATIWP